MSKICWQMPVYSSDFFLREVLQSILPFGPLVVSEGAAEYWARQGYSRSTDKTCEILEEYKDYGQGIIGVLHGQWATKTDEMNASIHLVPDDTQFLIECDSDEIFKARDIERIMQLLDSGLYDSMSLRMWSFFGGFQRYMTGFEENFEVHRVQRFYPGARWATHRPPTILNPKTGRPWREGRHLGHYDLDAMGIRLLHYGYVMPRQMKDKADYYFAYAPNRDIPNYFRSVYLPWVLGDDKKKQEIEDQFDGVHNWKPEARGPCRTAKFMGTHPPQIVKSFARLQMEFAQQLKEYTGEGLCL